MARPRKTQITQVVEKPEIVVDNIEKDSPVVSQGAETITIACHLPFALAFDDVPNGAGGTKTIVFPSVNSIHRNGGVLVERGKAAAVTIARADWEAIVAMHGREIAFTGRDGMPPCLIPMKDAAEFKARQSEIVSEMVHGLEPLAEADLEELTKV